MACSAGEAGQDGEGNSVPAFPNSSGPATQSLPSTPVTNANGASNSPTGSAAPGNSAAGSGAQGSGSQGNGAPGNSSPSGETQPSNAPIAAGTPSGGMAGGNNSGTNAGGAGGSASTPSAPSGAAGAGTQPPATPPPATPPAPQMPPPATPPPAAPVNCGSQFLCEDFEGVATGASPNAAIWTVIDNYSPRPTSANVQVSAQLAHGGRQSLRVAASGGRYGIRATVRQNSYFMRAWLNVDAVPLGPVFVGLGASESSEIRLRIQGRSFATINTVGPGDAVHPDAANSGNCTSCVTLVPNRWFCAEFSIDNAGQNATLWIDGVEAASIVNGDKGWPVQDEPNLFVGSMGLQGGMAGVYIDDVAAGPTRIGCN